jgi:hypothetical protein
MAPQTLVETGSTAPSGVSFQRCQEARQTPELDPASSATARPTPVRTAAFAGPRGGCTTTSNAPSYRDELRLACRFQHPDSGWLRLVNRRRNGPWGVPRRTGSPSSGGDAGAAAGAAGHRMGPSAAAAAEPLQRPVGQALRETVSKITDEVADEVLAWQRRPL